ncbi:MAG: ankyrin repeat domain-containing protein [Verrucomicrobia bacterium]|nr:ankyrin repeat domain-containing protein [Verrucomicrobiota bacterium]
MSMYVQPQDNSSFFQQFYACSQTLSEPAHQYRLVKSAQGYAFEEKTSISLLSYLQKSYSIDTHAQEIFELAQKKISTIDSEEGHELLACSKTCRLLGKILKHVYKSRAVDSQNICADFKSLSYQALVQAATMLGISPLQLACEHSMGHIAIECVKKRVPLREAQGHYTSLLQRAERKQLPVSTLLELIDLGADVKQTKLPIDDYLWYALTAYKGRAARALILAGANCNKVDEEKNSPLHFVCVNYSEIEVAEEVVDALFEKGVDLSLRNGKGDTALHIAVSELNLPLTRRLIAAHANVTQANAEGLLPFQMANPKEVRATLAEEFFSEYFDGVNLLERPFLLRDIPEAKKIIQEMTSDEFHLALSQLREKYPQGELAHISLIPLSINSFHYHKTQKRIEIETPPPEIKLDMMLELFDAINFTETDGPNYRKLWLVDSKGTMQTVAHHREQLQRFINKIKNREVYQGTPKKKSAALTAFYDHIEKAVKNTIATLRANEPTKANIDLRDTTCFEYIKAAPLCGPRNYNVSTKKYLTVCKKISPTFEDEIYTSIAEYREILFETTLKDWDHNLHDYHYVLQYLGGKYGLPGANALAACQDPFRSKTTCSEAETKFLELYTSFAVVKEWVEPLLKDDYELKYRFLDWCTSHIPQEWQMEHFGPIIDQVKKMQENSCKNDEIWDFLASKEIYPLQPTMTPLKAIQNEREAAYLGTEVYDMTTGTMRLEAIVRMLTKLGVVSSSMDKRRAPNIFEAIGSWAHKLFTGELGQEVMNYLQGR